MVLHFSTCGLLEQTCSDSTNFISLVIISPMVFTSEVVKMLPGYYGQGSWWFLVLYGLEYTVIFHLIIKGFSSLYHVFSKQPETNLK